MDEKPLACLLSRPTPSLLTAAPGPVTNPFGTLPVMPQLMIGRSAGSGPSVQYGISSMPVSQNQINYSAVLPFTALMRLFSLPYKEYIERKILAQRCFTPSPESTCGQVGNMIYAIRYEKETPFLLRLAGLAGESFMVFPLVTKTHIWEHKVF